MSEARQEASRQGGPAPFARVVIVVNSGGDSSPVYSVVINADGGVLYKGRRRVIRDGRHEWRLSGDSMQAIAGVIEDTGVLALGKSDAKPASDDARLVTAIKMPGAKPVVVDSVAHAKIMEDFVSRVGSLAGLQGFVPDL